MTRILMISCAILTALAMVPAVAHALEWPGKKRLGREQYLAVQRIYYPGFTWMGVAEPLAVIVLAALLIVTPAESPAFVLTAAALAAAAATHAIYWLLTAPVNKRWLRGETLSGSADRFFAAGSDIDESMDWTALRDRWEMSHIYRSITATVAFVLVVLALAIR